jgi:hypothetical protein
MPDFYFRGTIAQFWKLIHAEYQRLEASCGRPPFKLESLGGDTHPNAEYVPAPGEVLVLTFFNADYTDNVLVVEAQHRFKKTVLDITCFPQGNAFEENNKLGYAMWAEIVHNLLAAGYFIDPQAEVIAASHTLPFPPEPPSGSDVFTWLDWRIDMLKAGQKCTLKQVASRMPRSYSRLRNIHKSYKIQRGLPNGYERRYKKRYKN